MAKRLKLAYVGAGSFRFSIGLFRNIVAATELLPMDVALCDIDADSLDLMARILRRMVKKAAILMKYEESDITVSSSTDRRAVLDNADFVCMSISVGLQAAEWIDIYLPLKCGIPQNTGDTVGPGGLFRALRTNPVCAAVVRDVKELCPRALVLNYSNPISTCSLAARTAAPDIQFIGLCHELFGGMETLRHFYGERAGTRMSNWRDIAIRYGGVNHFSWLTSIEYAGRDLYPPLRNNAHQLVLDGFRRRDAANGFNFHLLEKTGYFPYPGARHVAEFLPDYYNYFNHERENQCPHWDFPPIRDVPKLALQRRLAYLGFRMLAKGLVPTPGPTKEGELAIDMAVDWLGESQTEYVMNVMNSGTVPELPDECVVEVPGRFHSGRVLNPGTVHLSREVADYVRPHCEQQELTVRAALGDDIGLVVKAMVHDPMNAWIEDDDRIEHLARLMLFYEQQWLPKEWKEWIPTKRELMRSKYWVSPEGLSARNGAYLRKEFPVREELRRKAFFWPRL